MITSEGKWFWIAMGILAGCFILAKIISVAWRRLYQKLHDLWCRSSAWLTRHYCWAIALLCIIIIVLYDVQLIIVTIELQKVRKMMRYLGGDGVQDEWGWGQTTAVLLWMPFVWVAIIETISQSPFRSNVTLTLTRDSALQKADP